MKNEKLTKTQIRKLEKKEDNKRLKEWSQKVKDRDKECVLCGSIKLINAHHIIPREIKEFRYELDNGVSLCPLHHKFSKEISAHKNPLIFYNWFISNRKEQYLRLIVKYDKASK